MNLKNGRIINVQVYKHDGTLHRQLNGVKVIEVSDKEIICFMNKTKVVEEKKGKHWKVKEPFIWWFPKDVFYNTTGLIRPSGTHFYTNLASPPIFEDNTIKYIDYDLDIKAYPENDIKVVDQNEYKVNKEKYKYPKKLEKILETTTNNVIEKIKNKEDFFNEEKVNIILEELILLKLLSKKILKKKNDFKK